MSDSDSDVGWEEWEAYENSITNLTHKLGKIQKPDVDHLQLAFPHLATEDAKNIISCFKQNNQVRRDSIKKFYPNNEQVMELLSDHGKDFDISMPGQFLTTPEKKLFEESRKSIMEQDQLLFFPNQQQKNNNNNQQQMNPRLLKERDSLTNFKDVQQEAKEEEHEPSEAENLLKESEKEDDLAGSECNVTIGDGRVCGRYHYKTDKKCWILKHYGDDYLVSLKHDGTWKLIDSDGETLYHNENHGKFPPPSEWIQTNEDDDLPIPAPSLKIFFIPKRKPIKRGKQNSKNKNTPKRTPTHKMNPKYELSEEEHMKRVMEQQKELKGQKCSLCEEGCIIS